MRIALAGNPNSGKTTMYNALTGSSERVGNWAGVTVDKMECAVKKRFVGKGEEIIAVDLPGAYSMSPFTSEESVTSEYVKNERPDGIINIVDSTNLSRSLFFTTQLLELGIPVVVALNKTDANSKKGNKIDAKKLSEYLGCPVVETVSTSAKGLSEVVKQLTARVGTVQSSPYLDTTELSDKDAAKEADKRRFEFVNDIVAKTEDRKVYTKDKNFQDKIDAVLTNRWAGIPIFAAIMFLVFQISQVWVGPAIAEGIELKNGFTIPGFVTLIEWFAEWVGSLMANANPFLTSVVVDGLIGGVGAVVGFLPLVMVMYFLLALLEDCGYMARVTVVLDPIFKKAGLSGKSVIPFVIGTGCAIPGVMACRTIRDERERRATALLAPFMPCGAKLPVIALFAGAFFGESRWVGVCMYFVGILLILASALLVNLITGNIRKKSYFIMELPEYKAPSIKKAAGSMCRRGWSYVVKAGTIILVCNFLVHIMQSFSFRLSLVDNPADSILYTVATPFAYLLAPITGVVAWQLAAAAITGFIAKENVVGTLAVCFVSLEAGLGDTLATSAAALAYLMFNLFSPPCFAAIGAMNAEMKSKRWLIAGIGLQLGVGYSIGFLVNFFGTLFAGADFGSLWMTILGWTIVLGFAAALTVLIVINQNKIKKDMAKKAKKAEREKASCI